MFSISSKVFFLYFIWLIIASANVDVKVYHYLSLNMGHPFNGFIDCGQSMSCEWSSSLNMGILRNHFMEHQKKFESTSTSNNQTKMVTVSVYNLHEWIMNSHFDKTKPALCFLPTNLTMGESEV